MNVANFLNRSAERYPHRLALAWGTHEWTYAETQRRVQALARGLLGLGIQIGDRIVILQLNGPQLVETLLACLSVGACAVPLNARLHPEEWTYYCDDCSARLVVFSPQFASEMHARRERFGTVEQFICVQGAQEGQVEYESLIQSHSDGEPVAAEVNPNEDLGWLFYTSGTTGKSKGAMLTHAVLNFMTVSYLADLMDIGPEDATLHAGPMTHGSGLQMFAALARGSANVIPESQRFEPSEILELIESRRITNLFLAPTMIRMLLDAPDFERRDLSSLRYVIYGGSVIHLSDLKEAIRRFGTVLVQIFGQGETPMTGTFLPRAEHVLDGTLEQERRLLSAGVARTGIETRIFDEIDREVPRGEFGELVIRGPSLMKGYWNKPEATQETLRNGWLHTGDIAYMDDGGYVFIMDRSKDLIISGGANIYPREVEEVLLRHPAVHEVAVLGIPDLLWGEAVHAVVVPKPGVGVTAEELITFCQSHLASYKKPKTVTFAESLPKSAYGKVLKRELRATFWAAAERKV
jgi:long-chain acyl-CoA synthetase